MMNLPFAVPSGMEQNVHEYFGTWAIAETQANGLLGLARNLDVSRHLARVAAAQDRRRMLGDDGEPEDDEEENVDDGRDADKPKSDAWRPSREERLQARTKPAPTLAALPGLEAAAGFEGFITADGVAVIEARGTLMKFSSSFSSGTSTVRLRKAVRSAVADGRARAILLVIDSPGGTVSGTAELADDVASAAAKKPLWVYGEDLLASAAFWVASQSSRIGANRTAMVGSLGTVMVVYDMSKAFAEAGVEPVVFKSGDAEKSQKGAATPGTAITESNRAYFQALIDETNTHFRSAVEKGRPKADAKTGFAEAAVYMADRAQKLGLIDAVCSVEQFYNDLVRSLGPGRTPAARADATEVPAAAADEIASDQPKSPEASQGAGVSMSAESKAAGNPSATTAAVAATAELIEARVGSFAATLADLKAACPGASSDFLVAQLEAGATVDQARTAFIAHLQAQLAAGQQGGTAATAAAPAPAAQPTAPAPVAQPAAPAPAAKPAGVPLIPTKASANAGDVEATASEELDRLAKDMVGKRPGMNLTQAKQRILSSNVELRGRLAEEETAVRAAARAERFAAIAAAVR